MVAVVSPNSDNWHNYIYHVDNVLHNRGPFSQILILCWFEMWPDSCRAPSDWGHSTGYQQLTQFYWSPTTTYPTQNLGWSPTRTYPTQNLGWVKYRTLKFKLSDKTPIVVVFKTTTMQKQQNSLPAF